MTMASFSPPAATDAASLPPCLCGHTRYRRVRGPYEFLGSGPRFEVAACGVCGLARTAPPPYDDELDAAIYQVSDEEEFMGREAEWRAFFAPMLAAALRHRPGGRLLDLGCGVGLSVRLADEAGYEGWGVEINRQRAACARDRVGVRVVNSDLAAAAFPDAHFSVVLLSHVLEHLSSPRAVFDEMRRVLAPDGVAVIDVPNMAGLLVPLLGDRWTGWMPDMHVWQFTPATLRTALRQIGWEPVEMACRHNIHMGDPRNPLKRLVRRTAVRAAERAASALNRADKILCVARPLREAAT